MIEYFETRRKLANATMRVHPRLDPRGQVREVWLIPLDDDLFDRIWSAGG